MNKQFIVFIALFFLVLSANAVLAAPSLNMTWLTSPSDVYQGQNQTAVYNITNNGDSNLTVSLSAAISSLNLSSSESSINLPVGNSVTRDFVITTSGDSKIGSHTLSITAVGLNASSSNATAPLSASFNLIYPYCDINSTNSPIKLLDITNEDDIEDEEFKPLESFDIKVKVENTDDDEDYKVILNAVLVQDNEEVDDTDIEKKINLDSDSKETVTLVMNIPSDIDEGNYYLYVKVTNDDDEDNCMQRFYPIEVTKSKRELVFERSNEITNVSCNSNLILEGDVVNIGREDEEKVKIVYSDSFGNSDSVEYENLDAGDSLPIIYTFNVPRNVSEGNYASTLKVFYDYDEDNNLYDESDSFITPFKVVGACQPSTTSQTITTEASTAILGVESEVRVKIANTGTTSQTYIITASADWADINSITPSSVSLAAGEEKEVIIKIEAKSGTDIGAHDMTVNVKYGSLTESQTVPVAVQKSSSKASLLDQLKFQLAYNPTWIIIDAVLVIAIILVVVLLLTGKKSA